MDCILRTFENCFLLFDFQHLTKEYGEINDREKRTSLQGVLFAMRRGESVII